VVIVYALAVFGGGVFVGIGCTVLWIGWGRV
jgi:hypothetical protein